MKNVCMHHLPSSSKRYRGILLQQRLCFCLSSRKAVLAVLSAILPSLFAGLLAGWQWHHAVVASPAVSHLLGVESFCCSLGDTCGSAKCQVACGISVPRSRCAASVLLMCSKICTENCSQISQANNRSGKLDVTCRPERLGCADGGRPRTCHRPRLLWTGLIFRPDRLQPLLAFNACWKSGFPDSCARCWKAV